MKTTILASLCVFALSTPVAFAQPSQGQGGGQTGPTSNSTTSSGSMMNNSGTPMSNPTTGTASGGGMSGSNMSSTGMRKDGVAANPSSQGNVGPGTTPGNPGSSAPSR